jgi:predicted  nucleic acid-binding Zn-ribbon protein
MPLLSIVTTVYDRADSLATCLRSVANLDFQDYEHIIVADHPPEDSLAALQRVVAEAGDPRVLFRNLPKRTNDLGITPAQTGLRRAEGKYVAFLDDDNVYLPSHFNALIQCLEENPGLGFAYSACLWNAELLLNVPSPEEGRIDLGQVLFRRDLFRTQFNDELKYSGYTWDWQLISQLLSRSVAFRFIDQETFVFRAAQFPRLQPEAPIESARKRIDELVRSAQHARRDFSETLRRAQDEIVRLNREHERVSLAYRDVEEERSRFADMHQDLQREHDRVARAYRDVEQERDRLARSHQELQGEHDRLARSHQELQDEHDRVARAYRDVEQERDRLARSHQELQGEHDRVARAYRDVEQERDRLARSHQELQGEHARVSHALEQERDRLGKSHEYLQGLRLEIEKLSAEARQRGAELSMLRQEHVAAAAAAETRRAALQYRLDSVLASRIWRWMAPVRALLDALGGGS